MLKRMKLWMAIALVIACGVVLTACAPDPGLPTKNEKTMEEACVQSIQALMSGDSYCILYEQEFSNVVRKTEYRRYEQDQLVLALEDSTQENRIFADGKYGEANGIGWVWEDDRPNYDANEWLREWSPEYMETTNWTSSDRTVSFNAVWDNPLNPQRQCSGQLTYTFNENWVLESVHREYVVLEGIGQVGGSIETITVLDEPPEKTMALIDSVARRCVAKEETRQLAIRQQVKVGSVDELLAAIAPNREIILEPGTYDLGQATDYGTGREGAYYFWEDMSDGYELVIRGVSNLMIRGAGMHSTNIETLPRYADVLNFQECSDITLSDFTAGHTDGYGECGAGVVYLYDCTNVNLSKLGLYGCGCVGLTTEYCGNVSLRDSDIYDCSSSAAVLRNSHWAEIVDCRIYRIGHELYGGYCIFETTECEDVMIDGCEIYDSRTSSLLCAANNQYDVIMKNNMIRNNRFEEAAMVLQGCSATMENNQFKDNSIRNWYKRSSNMAEDGNNKTLTEDILNEMYGAKPGEPVSPQLEIHVSTADEFLAAIGPNKRIVLDAQLYDLSTATGYGGAAETYYFWQEEHDGFGLVIRDVDNMTICGASNNMKKHTIVAVPRWANVLMFRACSNITVSGFTAGHTQGQGSCTGGVLRFEDSDRIVVDQCSLFGCGTKGVDTDDCADVTVKNCEIYECSEGGIEMRDTIGVTLENNTFRDIAGRNYLALIGCMDVTMDGEIKIQKDMVSSCFLSNEEQLERNALDEMLKNFLSYYWCNEPEAMKEYLSNSYEGDAETYGEGGGTYLGLYFEVTLDHVREISESGSTTFEIRYRPYKYDEGEKHDIIRFLLVTVVKENGEYKISDYQQKQ